METVEQTFQRSGNVVSRRFGGGAMVMAVESGEALGVEGSAYLVWEALEHPVTFAALLDELRPWAEDDAELRLHISDSLSQLRSSGLVSELSRDAPTVPVGPAVERPESTGSLFSPHRGVPGRCEVSPLASVAGWRVTGAPPFDPGAEPDASRSLLRSAADGGLTGPLVDAVEAGAVQLPDDLAAQLAVTHRARLIWCLQLERRLVVAARRLADEGVDLLVIKGPAIAHLDESDPALRTFSDIDLLVRSDHLDRAVRVLGEMGAVRPYSERRPGFDSRFAKSVTLTFPGGMEFDVHRSLCDGVHGFRIPLDRLFERPDRMCLAGTELSALAPVHRVLHSAYHAVLGSPRPKLMSLRDLAAYLADPAVDQAEVLAQARLWRGEAVLASAVTEVASAFCWLPPIWRTWLDSNVVAAREARIIDRQKSEGSSFGPAKVTSLRELPWRDRPSFALGVAVPSRDHLRSRDVRRVDHLTGGRLAWFSRRGPGA